ncbi:MAG: GDSL-type esterase/lipase family protein, partial [Actinomycetota bacterium]|nr:GDSL-type esterase/lipase family protein [Actinomycetota bacterium]
MRKAAAVGLPVAFAALIAVEVRIAAIAEYLPTDPGFRVDVTVQPPGGGHQPPLGLVVLGDSTAAGVGAGTVERALPVLVAERVAADLGRAVHVVGHGRAGARTETVRLQQVPTLARQGIDAVVILVGSNDVTHLT